MGLERRSCCGRVGLALAVALAVFGLAGAPALAAPVSTPEIEAQQARGEEVLAEIARIDGELERAVDAHNGATYRLGQIEAEIATNRRHLEIAKRSYRTAQRNLEQRIVALYQNGEEDVIAVILGATSLDDLLDRVDSARRVSSQDVEIVASVRRAKADIAKRERELDKARAAQTQAVAERAAQRQEIEANLAERERLYESIQAEVQDLIAEEKERQRRLAEEQRRREEEQRRIAAAAEAAGVDASIVSRPISEGGLSSISTPQGIGTAPPSRLGAQAVAIALQQLGKPYVWGAAGPSSFDCSGLVVYAYGKLGVSLPHHAATMYNLGVPVSWGELQPGDLVYANSLGHMGMYIGNGQYVAAPQTGDVVRIFNMADRSDWVGFKRVA